MKRRNLLSLVIGSNIVSILPNIANANEEQNKMNENRKWDKVFPQSQNVSIRQVTFHNRYGITLVGDLYEPKSGGKNLPAIAVCGPFGAVKEQVSGLYAQTLAEYGFVTLAFDPSFTGESSGTPRSVASPDINTEDFSAAVDFLTTLPNVNKNRIGILGVCGWGGFALNAAAMDTRIKATVASTMYDMSRVTANGYFDQMKPEDRYRLREVLNEQRTLDYASNTQAPAPGLPEKLTGKEPDFVQEYWDYYKTPRGFHPRSINSNGNWNKTSSLSFMNMPLLSYIDEIRNPVLIIHGERAHSRYFSEDAFKRLKGKNKELYIVPGAVHCDLYDNKNKKIPWQMIAEFYKKNL